MHKKLVIKTNSLKGFLLLFKQEEILENLSLGDTWHPSSGFVDEKILEGRSKIREVIEFNYDFGGLVSFTANIENIELSLVSKPNKNDKLLRFEVKCNAKYQKILIEKTIEKNTYAPGSYEITMFNSSSRI